MPKKDDKGKGAEKSLLSGAERIDRRDFLVTAGKLIIPTLGILGLSLSIGGKAQAADCKGTCGDFCTGGCSILCTRSCANDCDGKCTGTCTRSCANSCEGFFRAGVK